MIKQMIVYIAVFLLTLYCFFLYDHEIVAVMLVVEVVYLLISLLSLCVAKRNIAISIDLILPLAEKNQEIPVSVIIKSKARMHNAHVRVQLQVENTFTGEKERYWIEGKAGSKKAGCITFPFVAKTCGNMRFSIRKCWIYDILSILKIKKSIKETKDVAVLPECHLLPVEVTRKTREFISDAEEYSDRDSGDDPSELYQIREYQKGDSLRDIYWKLSAKNEELLVKEHGRPLGCVVLLWLNLQVQKKKNKKAASVILEAVASLSVSLLEEKCVHLVAWYEPENQKIYKKRVSKEEHVYELLHRLLYVDIYEESVQAQYEEAFRGHAFSTVVEFQADGRVIIEQEEKMQLSLKEGTQDWEKLYFIV